MRALERDEVHFLGLVRDVLLDSEQSGADHLQQELEVRGDARASKPAVKPVLLQSNGSRVLGLHLVQLQVRQEAKPTGLKDAAEERESCAFRVIQACRATECKGLERQLAWIDVLGVLGAHANPVTEHEGSGLRLGHLEPAPLPLAACTGAALHVGKVEREQGLADLRKRVLRSVEHPRAQRGGGRGQVELRQGVADQLRELVVIEAATVLALEHDCRVGGTARSLVNKVSEDAAGVLPHLLGPYRSEFVVVRAERARWWNGLQEVKSALCLVFVVEDRNPFA
mmetsp:Transcript_9490/g.26891  ORF Transcript_9490/g.26891 Transcript_9490/m.26891 type:complete len:283 (+) Transcript_9490:1159-2007(+)